MVLFRQVYLKKKEKDGFYADLIFIPNTVNAVTTMAMIPNNSFSMKSEKTNRVYYSSSKSSIKNIPNF